MNREEFLKSVIDYLKDTFNFDCNKDKFILNSGDNGVLMRGPFAGHSLCSLKEFVAKEKSIPIEYDYD